MRRVYEEKVNTIDPKKHLQHLTFEEGLERLLDGSSLIYVETESYVREPEYPCKIITSKVLR